MGSQLYHAEISWIEAMMAVQGVLRKRGHSVGELVLRRQPGLERDRTWCSSLLWVLLLRLQRLSGPCPTEPSLQAQDVQVSHPAMLLFKGGCELVLYPNGAVDDPVQGGERSISRLRELSMVVRNRAWAS